MGLLSKVVSSSVPDLDEMGKTLRDRLSRLAQNETSSYTALSLLKAYGSFQVGLCLSLKEDTYESYAVVGLGLGVNAICIPREKIQLSPGGIQKVALQPEDIGSKDIQPLPKELEIWAFPLDTQSPCQSLILMGVDPALKFNADGVGTLLSQVRYVFLLPPDIPLDDLELTVQDPEAFVNDPAVSIDEGEISNQDEAVRQWIEDYAQQNPEFQGVLLDIPENIEPHDIDAYFEQLSVMVAFFGKVFQLPSNYALILFSQKLDGELISHRLSKTLKAVSLVTFLADNPDKAFTAIQPYL